MLKTLSLITAFGQNRDEPKEAPGIIAALAIVPKEDKEIQNVATDSAFVSRESSRHNSGAGPQSPQESSLQE
jgi:hypothetical protein